MGFDVGGPQYGLNDGAIGIWNGDGTYSSVMDIFSVQLISASLTGESQDLEGDDTITATATRFKKAEIKVTFGSVQMGVIQLLTGTPQQSAYSGNYKRVRVSIRKPRYVGIAGKSLAEEGNGDTHLFIPKCKSTSGFEIRFEKNAFSVPELTLTAVSDNNFLDADGNPVLFDIVEHAVAQPLAFPPVF